MGKTAPLRVYIVGKALSEFPYDETISKHNRVRLGGDATNCRVPQFPRPNEGCGERLLIVCRTLILVVMTSVV